MPILQIFVLAIIQGVTEFLPISSSAHLILVPALTAWDDQGPLFDVAVHVGTLGAVMLYFWRDTRGLALAGLGAIGIRRARHAAVISGHSPLFWSLIIATLPVVIAGGLVAGTGLLELVRWPTLIAVNFIMFGLVLWWADRRPADKASIADVKVKAALLIGLAQCFALLPGASRAGVTMSAARLIGIPRADAAKFSMLLGIPTLIASGLLAALTLGEAADPGQIEDALLGAGLSFIAALGGIHFLMRWLSHASMSLFVGYRIVAGLALLGLIEAGIV